MCLCDVWSSHCICFVHTLFSFILCSRVLTSCSQRRVVPWHEQKERDCCVLLGSCCHGNGQVVKPVNWEPVRCSLSVHLFPHCVTVYVSAFWEVVDFIFTSLLAHIKLWIIWSTNFYDLSNIKRCKRLFYSSKIPSWIWLIVCNLQLIVMIVLININYLDKHKVKV